ncbi:MAG: M15 family metallopeptidase [Clostridia bacterium]|nr:M15 family metallopeptidase [Clostridia bacterium]MBQ6232696.1 M15 family metallopeptidase [Clostridia bacterium]
MGAGLPEGFAYVRDLIPDVVEEMYYATEHNFVGAPIDGYQARRAILTRKAAQALGIAALAAQVDGHRLVIFDAYRPERAVRHFMRWAEDAQDVRTQAEYYPEFADKQALISGGFIAKRSGHSRGSTVDLTLMSMETGKMLEMGTDFDRFGPLAAHGAEGISETAAQNRAYLCRLMLGAGFVPYSAEWWHYTLKDEPYPDTYFDFIVK